MNAMIEIKFSRPVCVELYRDNKVMGRFMLRYSGKTIAAGMITEVRFMFTLLRLQRMASYIKSMTL